MFDPEAALKRLAIPEETWSFRTIRDVESDKEKEDSTKRIYIGIEPLDSLILPPA